jgi:hypothetical protein
MARGMKEERKEERKKEANKKRQWIRKINNLT